jgi:predicted ATPase
VTEQQCFSMLASLVRQSLVSRVGPDRYRLLDTLRAYAVGLLEQSAERTAVHRRHALHQLSLAEKADLGVRTGEQKSWLALAHEALPDMRAALAWCLDGNAPEVGARLVGALAWFWTLEGLLAEARSWLDRAEQFDSPTRKCGRGFCSASGSWPHRWATSSRREMHAPRPPS